MVSRSIISYLKTSQRGDISILIWHMSKMKQRASKRQNLYQVNRNFWKCLEKHKAFRKMKLSLTVGPLIRSPDTTTYELKNVLIYVDHHKHPWQTRLHLKWKSKYALSWEQTSPWITMSNVLSDSFPFSNPAEPLTGHFLDLPRSQVQISPPVGSLSYW